VACKTVRGAAVGTKQHVACQNSRGAAVGTKKKTARGLQNSSAAAVGRSSTWAVKQSRGRCRQKKHVGCEAVAGPLSAEEATRGLEAVAGPRCCGTGGTKKKKKKSRLLT
jgi:hypothetical protein